MMYYMLLTNIGSSSWLLRLQTEPEVSSLATARGLRNSPLVAPAPPFPPCSLLLSLPDHISVPLSLAWSSHCDVERLPEGPNAAQTEN